MYTKRGINMKLLIVYTGNVRHMCTEKHIFGTKMTFNAQINTFSAHFGSLFRLTSRIWRILVIGPVFVAHVCLPI